MHKPLPAARPTKLEGRPSRPRPAPLSPQLPPGVQLSRPEWGVLRGALGRPRRLSLAFLRQERARLELYRENVRRAFVDAGGGGLPPGMPRPLHVGQAVVARHPVTRRLADGIILTMQPSKYRVQFNRCGFVSARRGSRRRLGLARARRVVKEWYKAAAGIPAGLAREAPARVAQTRPTPHAALLFPSTPVFMLFRTGATC